MDMTQAQVTEPAGAPRPEHDPPGRLESAHAALRRLEKELGENGALYRTLFELMPGSVVLLDSQGVVLDANPFFCRNMGFTREELLGMSVTRFSEDPPEVIQQNLARLLAGETLDHEVTNIQKDGSRRFYELREAAITLPGGSRAILAVSNDITDRKQAQQARLEMERQLSRMQKLESLGLLAGGIAHDFNNLLTTMLGNVELALLAGPASSKAEQRLKLVLAAGHRAAGLVQQMLDYSGRGRLVISEVNLTGLVAELADVLKACMSKAARLEFFLAPGLPSIRADARQLQRVITHLVANAAEAMGEQGGVATLVTGTRDCEAVDLIANRLETKPPPGRFVFLEVRDTGCGMDETIQKKIFDPFFTTKFVGRGLGLSGVMGVVQAYQGAILVASQPGKGTAITLLFPAGSHEQTDEQRLTV